MYGHLDIIVLDSWVLVIIKFEDPNIPRQIPKLKAKQVSAGHLHTAIIDLENNVWMFGMRQFWTIRFW